MADLPAPPQSYTDFVTRFPGLGEAWEKLGEASRTGPLSERESRLVKLGIAIGTQREGPVHSAARKALACGASREDIDQVVALAASTIGLPAAVAAFTWLKDDKVSGA